MKKHLLIFSSLLLFACSGEEKKDSSGKEEDNSESNQKEKVQAAPEKVEESHSLEIKKFINGSEDERSIAKLPYAFNSFNYTQSGAVYDQASSTLSIYFANYDTPNFKYGMCCGKTEKGDQKTLSFIIKHDKDGNIDRKESFINYTDTLSFSGLNMIDRTMAGDYEMKNGYVEGSFTYQNDLDSSAYITTTFKLNLKEK